MTLQIGLGSDNLTIIFILGDSCYLQKMQLYSKWLEEYAHIITS